MRCPYCDSLEDKVVDSRMGEEGRAIRRRRECLTCNRRFTTYERLDEIPLLIVKRNGIEEPFDRGKVVEGIRKACKNRPVADSEIEQLAERIEDAIRANPLRPVPSSEIGREVLDRLHALDDVAYMRFASVYKDFQELNDFERELGFLLKKSPPKVAAEGTPGP